MRNNLPCTTGSSMYKTKLQSPSAKKTPFNGLSKSDESALNLSDRLLLYYSSLCDGYQSGRYSLRP